MVITCTLHVPPIKSSWTSSSKTLIRQGNLACGYIAAMGTPVKQLGSHLFGGKAWSGVSVGILYFMDNTELCFWLRLPSVPVTRALEQTTQSGDVKQFICSQMCNMSGAQWAELISAAHGITWEPGIFWKLPPSHVCSYGWLLAEILAGARPLHGAWASLQHGTWDRIRECLCVPVGGCIDLCNLTLKVTRITYFYLFVKSKSKKLLIFQERAHSSHLLMEECQCHMRGACGVGHIGMAILGKSNWAYLQLALIVREVEGIEPIAFSPVFS